MGIAASSSFAPTGFDFTNRLMQVLALTVAMYNNRAVCHKKEAEAAEALAKTAASELAEAKEAGVEVCSLLLVRTVRAVLLFTPEHGGCGIMHLFLVSALITSRVNLLLLVAAVN